MDSDPEIFEGKTFSSLARDIYSNSSHKREQINQIIKDLHTMVKDVGSATVVAPMIKDYLDVGVKNDDQLIKLSAVLQRVINSGSSESDFSTGGLSDAEKEDLLNSVRDELSETVEQEKKITKELDSLKEQTDEVESSDGV
tara:strand:- start:3 stop:425 length:423 start_codon:yes stop_codon:yes gene_type:complete